jgi:glutathione synthase/RimK-type ligase-like ATP-grasp enzyme
MRSSIAFDGVAPCAAAERTDFARGARLRHEGPMTTTKRVALATCALHRHGHVDDVVLTDALVARGIEVVRPVWNEPATDATTAPVTIIRSTWDYSSQLPEFLAWTARMDLAGTLKNPSSVIRWNTHKGYLAQLNSEGIPIVPTAFFARGDVVDVADVVRTRGFDNGLVIKPTVSCGSRATRAFGAHELDAAQAHASALVAAEDVLVQPFVTSIGSGETSLVFIDGAFTHAIQKVPVPGDFRSQTEFGGSSARVEPSQRFIDVATAALDVTGGKLLYARVDLVQGNDGRPWLMELELVEPQLFFREHPPAAERMARAIERLL